MSTEDNTGIVLYKSKDGTVKLDVQLDRETIWLSLNQLSRLFGRDKSVVSRHLRNIYDELELDQNATVAKNATVQNEGGRTISRDIEYYNLDAIISVGYRVNSKRGTEFRIWASNVLKQHLVKGYSVNEKRLKALNQTLRLAADKIFPLRPLRLGTRTFSLASAFICVHRRLNNLWLFHLSVCRRESRTPAIFPGQES